MGRKAIAVFPIFPSKEGLPKNLRRRERASMRKDPHRDRILILDFGSQYTQLIARRIRECRVYCEIHPFSFSVERIRAFKPKGIVLSGSPASVYDRSEEQPCP